MGSALERCPARRRGATFFRVSCALAGRVSPTGWVSEGFFFASRFCHSFWPPLFAAPLFFFTCCFHSSLPPRFSIPFWPPLFATHFCCDVTPPLFGHPSSCCVCPAHLTATVRTPTRAWWLVGLRLVRISCCGSQHPGRTLLWVTTPYCRWQHLVRTLLDSTVGHNTLLLVATPW